jgi:hypothetical protein
MSFRTESDDMIRRQGKRKRKTKKIKHLLVWYQMKSLDIRSEEGINLREPKSVDRDDPVLMFAEVLVPGQYQTSV